MTNDPTLHELVITITIIEALDFIERVRPEFIGTPDRIDPMSVLSDKIEDALKQRGIILPDRVMR